MKKTTAQILALTLFITFCGITPGAYAAADDLALETPNEVSWKDILSASWTKLKSYFVDSSVHAADASVSYVFKSPRNAAFGDLSAETLTVQRIIINAPDGEVGLEINGNGLAGETAIIVRDMNNGGVSPYAVAKDGTVYNMADVYMPAPMMDPATQMGPPLAANNAAGAAGMAPAATTAAGIGMTGTVGGNGGTFRGPNGGVPPGLRPVPKRPVQVTAGTVAVGPGAPQAVATLTIPPRQRYTLNCNIHGYGYSPGINPAAGLVWWWVTNKPWTPPWWKWGIWGPTGFNYPKTQKWHYKEHIYNQDDAGDMTMTLWVSGATHEAGFDPEVIPSDQLGAFGPPADFVGNLAFQAALKPNDNEYADPVL